MPDQPRPRPAPLDARRRRLFDEHLRLVDLHLRRRVRLRGRRRCGREYDDLRQVGLLALLKAARSWSPRKCPVFAPYALLRIKSAISRFLLEESSIIHVPSRALRPARGARENRGRPAAETSASAEVRAEDAEPAGDRETATASRVIRVTRIAGLENRLVEGSDLRLRRADDRSDESNDGEDVLPSPLLEDPAAGDGWGQTTKAVGHGLTVRELLRRCYMRAVAAAVDLLSERPWRARDPGPVFRRLAAERFLVAREAHRTPLRRIAAECGLAPSQALRYARALEQEIRRQFEQDAEVPLLLEFARRRDEGFDARPDAGWMQAAQQARRAAFQERFTAMNAEERAWLLCRMIRLAGDEALVAATRLWELVEERWSGGRMQVA